MSVNVGMQRAAEVFNSVLQADTDSVILQQFYREQDYISSPEAILKVLSIIVCIVWSVVLLSAACGGSLGAGGAALALGGAAALTALYAAAAFALPVYAPITCFYTDLIVTTVIGFLLLVTAILNMTFCNMVRVIDYVHGPLGLVNAGLALGSAAAAYASAARCWAAARRPAPCSPPSRSAPREHDV